MIQVDISFPETTSTADILGKDVCSLSNFIQHQGDNPPLKEIRLSFYSMPERKWAELFRFTYTCKYLKHLNLQSCNVGEAGRYLAQAITSWGDNPPLQELCLRYCSIPKQVWPEVLQSLSSCKQIINMDLSHNSIGEAGRCLAQLITSWGDDPPLKGLHLSECSIPEQVWPEVLQSLSSCKQITNMCLSHNSIGEAGRCLAQLITSWGDNPPLQKLYLRYSSIPEQVWPEVLQSLSFCKQLNDLHLSENTFGEAGHYLAQSITSLGDDQSLEVLVLSECSIPKQVWPEVSQSLSSCEQLTDLDLSDNTIGEAGSYLAQSITSWGCNPPLETLNLRYCSIPEQVWAELLQSLSSCKLLSSLFLSVTTIGKAGHYLAQSITSWGNNPPLEKLGLRYCSMPEQVWSEVLQSLSSCKQITNMDLSHNSIGEAGRCLAQSITLWGDNPELQELDLCRSSIREQVWSEVLQSLSFCKQLTDLRLSKNTIGEAGHYLTQSITSWGDNPLLKELGLSRCLIPEQVWPELLQSLSTCRHLRKLDLSGNTLTGCLSSFLSDPNPGLTSLRFLYLKQTALNKSDIQHLTHLVQTKKLSGLNSLFLEEERWTDVEDELLQLKEVCHRNISLDLPKTLQKKLEEVQMTCPFLAH